MNLNPLDRDGNDPKYNTLKRSITSLQQIEMVRNSNYIHEIQNLIDINFSSHHEYRTSRT